MDKYLKKELERLEQEIHDNFVAYDKLANTAETIDEKIAYVSVMSDTINLLWHIQEIINEYDESN